MTTVADIIHEYTESMRSVIDKENELVNKKTVLKSRAKEEIHDAIRITSWTIHASSKLPCGYYLSSEGDELFDILDKYREYNIYEHTYTFSECKLQFKERDVLIYPDPEHEEELLRLLVDVDANEILDMITENNKVVSHHQKKIDEINKIISGKGAVAGKKEE